MKLPLRRNLEEASELCGIPPVVIIQYIEEQWISPIDRELPMLDEEDINRILFIVDLKKQFGVNDESIPIILHLIDQLNFIIHNPDRRK